MAKNVVRGIVRNMENGNAAADLPAYCSDGPEVEFSFNSGFVITMASAPGVLHLGGPNDPAAFRFDGNPDRVAILMPRRT
jgi:DNA polymerase III sliding clamp (beta) subunit (PCNA family)